MFTKKEWGKVMGASLETSFILETVLKRVCFSEKSVTVTAPGLG